MTDLLPLPTFFLIATRLGMIILFSPLEVIRRLPVQIRLILILLFSFFIISNLNSTTQTSGSLLAAFAAEFINAQLIYLALITCFGCFQVAGQLIDFQNGLNGISVFKPGEGFDSISAHLLGMLAGLFFFASQGHHRVIKLLLLSFIAFPPGELIGEASMLQFIRQFALVWSLGMLIAAPLVFCLWLTEFCSGVLSRNMPQISPYFLILPLKVLLGFFIFYLLINNMNPLFEKTFELGFQAWQEYLL
ncbi:flagellar biosynthetic protein FliR [Legionella genomosp. 1]|uniref:flagellar biosynthetic protein FliR n=1 Tax=Legionella genomosp. 1 TaxID=1093625 RepID=UPI0010552E8F|nr:flagellar biosynthetic protein FliR [Legionella genomosp. 1]